MKTIYFGLWDNALDTNEKKIKGVEKVIKQVEEDGKVRVSFDYNGRTRHEIASHKMTKMIRERGKDYIFNIGYNYHFEIHKGEETK